MSTRILDLLARVDDENLKPDVDEQELSALPPSLRVLYELDTSKIAPGGKFVPQEPDVGIGRAFTAGIKTGLLQPLSFLGVDPESDLTFDERGEQVSNFVGSMVGLGIGFIPFAAGTGILLRGAGLTKSLKAASTVIGANGTVRYPLYELVRNTIAGAAQFAGEGETVEEAAENALVGAAFGGAIEGVMLTRAMRGRKINPSKLFDDGSPVGDIPVDADNLAKETAAAPSASKSASENIGVTHGITREPDTPPLRVDGLEIRLPGEAPIPPDIEIPGLRDITPDETLGLGPLQGPGLRVTPIPKDHKVEFLFDNIQQAEPLSAEQVLTEMTRISETTVSIPDVTDPEALVSFAKSRLPNTAQVLSRSYTTGVGRLNEVLIHNPLFPEDALSPKQIAQWKVGGFPENMKVIYRGAEYVVTGVPVTEGRIQLRSIARPGHVFEPKVNEVTRPIFTQFHSETPRKLSILREAIEDAELNIGFAVHNAAGTQVRRGFVDTANFEIVGSFDEFIKNHARELSLIQANSQEEAIQQFVKKKGIQGLEIKNDGVTSNVMIFDQSAIKWGASRFNTGVTPDAAQVVYGESGEIILNSFTPSWKNSIVGALTRKGLPEKEIKQLVDLHAAQYQRRLTDLMDDEFKKMQSLSTLQFGDCL